MNSINAFKKWLLNILVPYIEGTKKKKENKK